VTTFCLYLYTTNEDFWKIEKYITHLSPPPPTAFISPISCGNVLLRKSKRNYRCFSPAMSDVETPSGERLSEMESESRCTGSRWTVNAMMNRSIAVAVAAAV